MRIRLRTNTVAQSALTQSAIDERIACLRSRRAKAPPKRGLRKGNSVVYTLKLEPQPQVDFTWGLSNLKPAASSVST